MCVLFMMYLGCMVCMNVLSLLYGACREYVIETMRFAVVFLLIGMFMLCVLVLLLLICFVLVVVLFLLCIVFYLVGKIVSGGVFSCRSFAASERSVDGRTCCFGMYCMFVCVCVFKVLFVDCVIKSVFLYVFVLCMKCVYDDIKYLLFVNFIGYFTVSFIAYVKFFFLSEFMFNMIG